MPSAPHPLRAALEAIKLISSVYLAGEAGQDSSTPEEDGFEHVPEPGAAPAAPPPPAEPPAAPAAEMRYYCVWSVPAGAERGAGSGIYAGSHPATWRAILAQGLLPESNSYAGSGISLRRYNSEAAAQSGWRTGAPRRLRATLPAEAPIHRF